MATRSISELVELAKETARSEWPEIVESAFPLDPADLPGEVLIGHGFYGETLVDGWHRTAGMLAWATRQAAGDSGELEYLLDCTEIPVRELSESETREWAH